MGYLVDINDIANECHKIAAQHGLWQHSQDDIPSMLVLRLGSIISEMHAAILAMNDNNFDIFREELADIAIIALDIAGYLNATHYKSGGFRVELESRIWAFRNA